MPRHNRDLPSILTRYTFALEMAAETPMTEAEASVEIARGLIRDFIVVASRDAELADTDDIFAKGIVNSMFAMELVAFIELTFDLTIEVEDLDIENFSSVNSIVRLVSRKVPSTSAGVA